MAKILLIEDSPIVVKVIREFLSRQGHEVEALLTPFGATNRVAEYAPDVLLMDLGLPGLNGETLLRLVRQRVPGMGVVVVSSADEATVRRVVNGKAADDYFTKGNDLMGLLGKIERLLARRSAA